MGDLECPAASIVQCGTIRSIASPGGGVTHRSWEQQPLLDQEG
jgi:hypothetical protein